MCIIQEPGSWILGKVSSCLIQKCIEGEEQEKVDTQIQKRREWEKAIYTGGEELYTQMHKGRGTRKEKRQARKGGEEVS